MSTALFDSIGLLIGRLALGAYFMIAGWVKITTIGPGAFADQNMGAAQAYLPDSLARPFLLCLPYIELVCGVALAFGLLTRVVSLAIAALLVSFIIAITGIDSTNAGGGPFHPNVILLALALLLFFCGSGRYGLDGRVAMKKARANAGRA